MRKVYIKIFAAIFGFTVMLNMLQSCSYKKESNYEKAEGKEDENEEYDRPDAAADFQYKRNIDPATGTVPIDRMWKAVLQTEALKNINPNTASQSKILAPLSWTERGSNSDAVGPSNGNLRPGNGVTSGRMRAVWADLADASRKTVWIGGVDGGIWKTNDVTVATPNWTLVNDYFSNLAITSICQDPTNTNIMYFSTGEAFFNSGAVNGNGVFKSTDHGVTWNLLPSSTNLVRCSKILCDAAGNVYVSTIGISVAVGLQRSTDGGNTWVSINPFTTTSRIVDFEISSTGTMHVSGGLFSAAGVGGYRYTKNPAAATPVWLTPTTPFNFPSGGSSRTELACVGNTVYASLGQANEKIDTIAKSIDGGDNWTMTALTATNISDLQTGQAWYSQGLMADPSDPNTVIVGNLRLLKSTDGGATFSKISEWVGNSGQYVHADIHNITWVDNGNKLLIGTDGGLFFSSDKGLTFSDKNTGLRLKQFNGVAVHPTLTNYFLCGAQDNGTHQFNNPGLSSSIEVLGGDGSITAIDQDEPQFQTSSVPFANFRRSTNGGATWINGGSNSTKGMFVNPYDFDNVANKIYSSGNAGQFLRWEDPHTGFTFTDVTIPEFDDTAKVSSVTSSTLTANREYFGLNTGKIVRIDNADQAVPISTIITPAAMPKNAFVTCVAEGNGNVQNLLATVGNYNTNNVYSTVDGGTTWASCDGNLPNMPVYWAVYHPDADTKAYIATETGIWSTDLLNGPSTIWTPETTFPTVKTTMLKYRASDRTLAAATYGRGLWTATVPNNTCAPAAITTQPVATTVCAGGTATFTVAATGFAPLTYQWQVSTTGTGGTFTNVGINSATLTLTGVTTAMNNNVYHVIVTNSCPSTVTSANVLLTVQSTSAPVVASPVTYCQNASALPLTANGTNLLWYGTNATGGMGSTTAPTPNTSAVGSTTYYVSQTGTCGEGPRASILVNITAPPSAPGVISSVTYCQGATATALTATGQNLLWYTASTGGTGSSTAPTPNTSTAGSITYYVSQTVGCESPRSSIVVNVNATPSAPTVNIQSYTVCQNQTGVIPFGASGSNLLWYTVATGGTGSITVPTPSTATSGVTFYYVSQTVNGCESPRTQIRFEVVATPGAPTVVSPVNYCQNATATSLTAGGTNLMWYTTASGGSGTTTAPTPNTTTIGSVTYYVSQSSTTGSCEGPRSAIVVNVSAVTAAPTVVSPITYCQGATATVLTASGTNLLWYSSSTGGMGSSTSPLPSTVLTGSTTYYVSQTSGCGESPRVAIVVNVNPTPAAPTVSAISYCQGTTASVLTATGVNLLWYGTNATGGTGSTISPTPSTATAGTTTYYVSQTIGICEGPRAAILVTVTALPTAPTVIASVVYCQGATATALTATGTGLLWYTTATGGVGVSTAPTPNTSAPGAVTYYVTQTNSCGEGPRAAIIVNTTATPVAATNLMATNITKTSALLNWTGAAGSFYTIEYKTSAANTWIVAAKGITANSIAVNNLTRGTTYNWRVYSNCSASVEGNVSSVATFTTTTRNNNIANLSNGFGLKLTPNPIQTSGILDYLVPENGQVTITILTVYGQTIRSIFNSNQAAGQYELNITNQLNILAKGTYIIKLAQNGNGISLKFIKN